MKLAAILALSFSTVAFAIGCGTSPDTLCKKIEAGEAEKPSAEDHGKCVKDLESLKEKKPDAYKCASKCMKESDRASVDQCLVDCEVTPIPERMCARFAAVQKEMKSKKGSAKGDEDSEKARDKCVARMTKLREKEPEGYMCSAKCLVGSGAGAGECLLACAIKGANKKAADDDDD